MSTISRRAFLKTVGVGALSVAAMSVLAGCEGVGTPETPAVDASVVPADFGRTYSVGDYNIATAASASAVDYDTAWYDAFSGVADYTNNIDASAQTLKWKDALATSEAREEYLKKCTTTADLAASADLVKVTVSITNFSDKDLKIANYSCMAYTDASKIVDNGSIFTATCDGKALACAASVGSTTGAAATVGLSTTATPVTVYVAAPVNVKEFTLTVAIPGTTSKFEYTVKNSDYKDLSKL